MEVKIVNVLMDRYITLEDLVCTYMKMTNSWTYRQ